MTGSGPDGSTEPPLVGVDEVASVLDHPDTVVCDVRWYLTEPDRGRAEYDAGHLPGAVFVDLATDLAAGPGAVGGGRHPLPAPARFAATLTHLGIAPEHRVIAYDSSGGAIAARLWWMLRSIGHDRVGVLDGGIDAWAATGRPLTTIVPDRPPTDPPYPDPGTWTRIVDADDVARLVTRGTVVVDARAAERYRGDHEPIDPRAGHVPGAINLPHLGNLGPDGRHLPARSLRERFADVGREPVVYCGSGVTACHDLLAMAVAGIIDGRLYPGSWSDWSSDPGRPAATGDQP